MSLATPSTPVSPAAAVAAGARAAGGAPPAATRRPRRFRWTVVVALLVGLVLSGAARQLALTLQTRAYESGPYGSTAGAAAGETTAAANSVTGGLDSYFLILTLGGLRGPLVMYLWSSSENQKNERDLEDFNTKVHLIRLLQPEFIGPLSYQAWNKAYNISVQIASLPDRYATILDAAEFVKEADRSRPNNVNILLQLNQIFQQKLGLTASDSAYYKREVRKDSKWRPPEPSRGVGSLAQRMEPLLDQRDRIQHQFLGYTNPERTERRRGIVERPADLPAFVHLPARRVEAFRQAAAAAGVSVSAAALAPAPGQRQVVVPLPEHQARKLEAAYGPADVAYVYADWNDGSELQYLRRYEPYTYGVSPLAIGFNYGKRAQVLINRTKQRPAMYSTSLVDSRPGLELKDWAKEERDRGLAAELQAFGRGQAAPQFVKWLNSARLRPTQPTEVDLGDLARRFLADPSAPPPDRSREDRWDEMLGERFVSLLATAGVPAGPVSGESIEEAMFGYRRAAELLRDGRGELVRHLSQSEEGIRRLQDFSSHIDEMAIEQLQAEADHDFLLALTPDEGRNHLPLSGQEKLVGRDALLKRAREKYRQVVLWSHYVNLRYYSPGELTALTFPPATTTPPRGLHTLLLWHVVEPYRPMIAANQMIELQRHDPAKGSPKLEFALPPSRPRELPEELLWEPDRLEQVYAATNEAIRRVAWLDQNRGNREEARPAEDRAARRIAEIDRMIGTASPSPRTAPTAGTRPADAR